ncbi:PCI domain-containing protein 2 [Orchesella cincta]|uniref:PCI domain-containing protein 2 homolog n=1 Tax=Orchesella cincta TaxID=48709 RepID=A0A1D2NHN2_ORCCI|nr:PCI domain-containing protein 2 [Orchesella cincta]
MANMTLNSYVYQVQRAWEDCDGDRVGELLSIRNAHSHSTRLLESIYEYNDTDQLTSQYALNWPLNELVSYHLRVLTILSTPPRSYTTALSVQCQFAQSFCKVLQSQTHENWALKVMEQLCRDLRTIALNVQKYEPMVSTDDHAPNGMEKAADVIMGLFRVCAADTRTQESETKRWGMLSLVNHLFIIYFRINRLHLCKPLIRAIEQQTSLKERFPREQAVTYKYYVGKKAMFDSEFRVAEECLEYAFKHASSIKNKRKILTYLIPVKMFLGILPTRECLKNYNLQQFQEVAESLKEGNSRRFYNSLKASEQAFIQDGVYLILEKLQMLLYRNLFKKVWLICGTHQVPISTLECALKWSGYNVTQDETHCIVANLIYSGQIRGYVSHQHQVLVVAKTNAFPVVGASSNAD